MKTHGLDNRMLRMQRLQKIWYANRLAKAINSQKMGIATAAYILAREYLSFVGENVAYDQPKPLLVIDGPPGIGKTTLLEELAVILNFSGYKTVFFSLDMFLRDLEWRKEVMAAVLSGRKEIHNYNEAVLWDLDRVINELLREIDDFYSSIEETKSLVIKNAFDMQTKKYRDYTFLLKRGAIFIIEGFCANLPILQGHYGDKVFRARLKDDLDKVRKQYLGRSSPQVDYADRERFHDLVFGKIFPLYAEATAKILNVTLNYSAEECDD